MCLSVRHVLVIRHVSHVILDIIVFQEHVQIVWLIASHVPQVLHVQHVIQDIINTHQIQEPNSVLLHVLMVYRILKHEFVTRNQYALQVVKHALALLLVQHVILDII